MKKILFLLLLFFSLNSYSQDSSKDTVIDLTTTNFHLRIHKEYTTGIGYTSLFFTCHLKVSEEMMTEAESKHITSDKMILVVLFDKKCQLESVKVKTKGILESFNKMGETYSAEIFNALNNEDIKQHLRSVENNCSPLMILLKFTIQ